MILDHSAFEVAGEKLTQSQLDEKCEDYLKRTFKEAVDFALENSLPLLLEDGLISKDAEVRIPERHVPYSLSSQCNAGSLPS